MDEDSLVGRLATRVGASPAEVVGLVVLVLAGLVAVAVLGRGPTEAGADLGSDTAELTLAPSPLLVHVTGSVRRPGVVEVADGARVIDVIALAGGAGADADLGALNLARLVVDGEQVVVPATREAGDPAPAAASAFDAEGRLNLNTATAQDFEQLPGIGPVLADRLVRHRETNGRFAAVGDLRAVSGIGEKTFQTLAPMVFV